VEQPLLLLGIDTRTTVVHFEAETAAVLFQVHGQADMTALGELDGIAQQVEQDLPHAHLVATDADRAGRIVATLEIQLALFGHGLHQRLHLVEQAGQVERTQIQLQSTGFDAREVQRIVDQPQQMAAGLLDGAGIAALHRVQRCGQQQLAHAKRPVIGVRTSCPSVARNRLLACEACSASSCLCTVSCHCWRRRRRARIDQTRTSSSSEPIRM